MISNRVSVTCNRNHKLLLLVNGNAKTFSRSKMKKEKKVFFFPFSVFLKILSNYLEVFVKKIEVHAFNTFNSIQIYD